MNEELKKVQYLSIALGFFLVFLNLYVYYYGWIVREILGENALVNYFTKVLSMLDSTYELYNWKCRLVGTMLIGLGAIGTDNRMRENPKDTMWITILAGGLLLVFVLDLIVKIPIVVVPAILIGEVGVLTSVSHLIRLGIKDLRDDLFNEDNESFPQEKKKMVNPYSINLPTKFQFRGKEHDGWINVVNPFRATVVMGTPGSGKSFAVINQYIKQQIEKGYSMYLYDFKYPDLTTIAFNHFRLHKEGYVGEHDPKQQKRLGQPEKVMPKFYIINFDDPRYSHRCNPIKADLLQDFTDAKETSLVILLNLNRSWVQKQGDFFVESPQIFLAAIIWFLKLYKGGEFCTLPHALELVSRDYRKVLPILSSYEDMENDIAPFINAAEAGAAEQLQGQLASAQIALARLTSKSLYWVMSGDDFSLDISNPKDPKLVAIGNNPDKQNIYSAALALYNSRIIKQVNKKNKLPSAVIIDELPTMYFKGIDILINTARSNFVSVCLGIQDLSQLERDYGKEESAVIMNTVGNVFAGQVLGSTAENLSKRFGRILQQTRSLSINKDSTSTSINTSMGDMIPPAKISNLSQGRFVGSVADNFGEEIEQKAFHCRILVDIDQLKEDEKKYISIPKLTNEFEAETEEEEKKKMDEILSRQFSKIKDEVDKLIDDEIERLKNGLDAKGEFSERAKRAYRMYETLQE